MDKMYQVWMCTNWGYGDGYEFTYDFVLFEGDYKACKQYVSEYEELNEDILYSEGQELVIQIKG